MDNETYVKMEKRNLSGLHNKRNLQMKTLVMLKSVFHKKNLGFCSGGLNESACDMVSLQELLPIYKKYHALCLIPL